MAQQTALSPAAIPGKTYSFSAKNPSLTAWISGVQATYRTFVKQSDRKAFVKYSARRTFVKQSDRKTLGVT